jgi:TolB-like protein
VWRGRIVSDGVLTTRLNAVRVAIGDSGREQRLIRTLPKHGLRFVGTVERDDPAADDHRTPPRRFAMTLPDAPALAVTPFANPAEDERGVFLAGALTDEVVAALWRHDWLRIVPAPRPGEARGDTPARYFLQGSVRCSGAQARVSVRLTDARGGAHLWAESFDAADSLAAQLAGRIQQQVTDHVFAAEALRGRLAGQSGVWSCLVGALALMNSREKTKVDTAWQLLQQAITIDPHCAPAYALLSFLVTLRVHLSWRSRAASRSPALALARRAITLDGEDAWAHLALGYATLQVCNQPEEAIEILQGALRLNPALSMAHYLSALSASYAGRPNDAFAHADMAERLHPHDLLARGNVGAYDIVRGTSSFVAGRHSEGIAYARTALKKNPRQVPAYRQLITNAASAGETLLARSALRAMERLTSGTETFIRESATAWQSPQMYQKMVEAYRFAGLQLAR